MCNKTKNRDGRGRGLMERFDGFGRVRRGFENWEGIGGVGYVVFFCGDLRIEDDGIFKKKFSSKFVSALEGGVVRQQHRLK